MKEANLPPIPPAMLVLGGLLALANIAGAIGFLTGPSAAIPGLGFAGPGQQASIMIAARQLGQGLVLGYGLYTRNRTILLLAWGMGIIRESLDLYARLQSGQGLSPPMIAVTLALQIWAFLYLLNQRSIPA